MSSDVQIHIQILCYLKGHYFTNCVLISFFTYGQPQLKTTLIVHSLPLHILENVLTSGEIM